MTRNMFRRFRREEDGLSLTEGVIVLPVVLIVITIFMEFGFAMYQWNQTAKAMQLGARLLAVSDPLDDLSGLETDLSSSGGTAGTPAPGFDGTDVLVCGAGSGVTACTNTAGMNRLVYGSDGRCDSTAIATTTPGVCDFNGSIGRDNLKVTYARSGLGYVGRPGPGSGLVVTITLETVDHTFDLPLLGALIGVNNIEIPALPVTVTSEDFTTCLDWTATC